MAVGTAIILYRVCQLVLVNGTNFVPCEVYELNHYI
jgi:hypothetical protein